MSDKFTCNACHETFDKEWTDEEAAEEAKERWGITDIHSSGVAVMCDQCYDSMNAWLETADITTTSYGVYHTFDI